MPQGGEWRPFSPLLLLPPRSLQPASLLTANEGLTNRTYKSALKLEWSPRQRALIEKNYSDEKRHLAWMKQAAKEKPWERGANASAPMH